MKFTRDFYIPKNATKIDCGDTDAEIHVYVAGNRPAGIAFHGKAQKPDWHFTFKTDEALAGKIHDYLAGRRAYAERKAERQQEKAKPHTLSVGDILSSSWGYDQTNVDFYQVVEVKSGRTVVIRKIDASLEEDGHMSGRTSAIKDAFIGEPMTKRADHRNSVKIEDYARASLWDGKSKYVSWYA